MSDSEELNFPLQWPPTPSPPGRLLRKSTCGKKKVPCPERDLKLEVNPFEEMSQETGKPYGIVPKEGTWSPSPQTLEYVVTGLSVRSAKTTMFQLLSNVIALFTGAKLELENLAELGKKPEIWLTLKIRGPNSGVDTVVKQVLLSMNFEETLTSHICSDGLTGIQSAWRSKEARFHSALRNFGSRLTSIQNSGIPILIKKR